MARWVLSLCLVCFLLDPWLPSLQAQPVGQQEPCRTLKANRAGTSRQSITVSTAAITVVTANQRLCDAILVNTSNTQKLRCAAPLDGTPTSTAGFEFLPLQTLSLELAAQKGLLCIRDTSASADAIVSVIELEP